MFISTAELDPTDPTVRIVDVRWTLGDPDAGERAYAAGHLPGAVYLSWLRDLSDRDDPVEGQLAGPAAFARVLGDAGIGPDTTVVTYDDGRIYLAARLVWALRHYGHADARILDGGYPAWTRAGRPVTTEVPQLAPRHYPVPVPGSLRATKADVLAALGDDTTIVDCRMAETYDAAGAHIPGAGRLPAPDLFDGGRLRDQSALRDLAAAAGLAPDQPAILYCGGGVSASAAYVALSGIGYQHLKVYDGSWTEWSADPHTPKEPHSPD